MGDGLYFRVLGPVCAERNGRVLPVGGGQRLGVLALLLLHAGVVVSIDEFTTMLWESAPPASFRVQLQGLVSGLRRILRTEDEDAPIDTLPRGYRLRVPAGRIDCEEVRRDLAAARELIENGCAAPAAELLRTALARWRGPAFAGVPYRMIEHASNALGELRLAVLGDRIDADLSLGQHVELTAELTALVHEHPLHERFRGQLMSALSRAGRPADALSVYQQAREILVAELGIEPSAPLRHLHRAILMGVNRPGSEWARSHLVPRQLPADVPTLVGRYEELIRITTLLQNGTPHTTSPGVLITGPGGAGKTALAVHAAHRLRDAYPDGGLYANLGGSSGEGPGPASVLAHFLNALGVPPGGVPRGLGERAGLFRELLADRKILIVLDDCGDDAQLRPLLAAEPGCGLIVTSRRRLIGGETLRPLQLGVLPPDAGLALLREIVGADRVDREPEASAEVVQLCDGLPLAIRVAGARLAARPGWAVHDMATRLADTRNRLDWLQTGDLGVRAGIREAVCGLQPRHRMLFRRIGLLETPEFPSWLAEALLDDDSGAAEWILDDLAEFHLVEPADSGVSGPRYRVHDLVRLAAREQAEAREDAAERRVVIGRTLHGWLGLAMAADDVLPHWIGLDPEPELAWRPPTRTLEAARRAPLAWFDEEIGTLLEVVRQADRADDPWIAWALAQRVSTYLGLRGRYDEWADVLAVGLRAAERTGDFQGQATMLGLLVQVEANRDDHETCLDYAGRTVAAYERIAPAAVEPFCVTGAACRTEWDDPLTVGFATARRLLAHRSAGDHVDYLALFERARDAFRAGGAGLPEAWTLKHIGVAYCRQGRIAEATETLLRGREVMRILGDSVHDTYAGGDLAGIAAAHGRYDEAEMMAREALERARAAGDRWSAGRATLTLGEILRARGHLQAALDAYEESLALWRGLRVSGRVVQVLGAIEELYAELGDDIVTT